MLTKTHADQAWDYARQLPAIDSPSGYTDRAAKLSGCIQSRKVTIQ